MYFEAEKRFRTARSPQEKVSALEEMLAVMPKHKGTDHLKADLRRKIAKLSQQGERKSGAQRASMILEKEGAAQAIVVGPPNSGKSQLVASVTNASPQVADYAFTSHTATPGMMEFENIQIQLVDTPPLVSGSTPFWLPQMMRRADLLVIVLDLSDGPVDQAVDIGLQLEDLRIGIAGGEESAETGIARKKALLVGNKTDLCEDDSAALLRRVAAEFAGGVPVAGVSARHGAGLEVFRRRVFQVLDIIRVYTKSPGQKPDFADPIVLPRGSTLQDAAEDVHKDFRARMKFARLWGSGKHEGVMAKRDHVLQDGDVIELHL